jgi:F420-dependent oxidoreductase-like protein
VDPTVIRLPDPCVVVLVGASGAGKSHWAAEQFPTGTVVSSDGLRALVGAGEHDQRAGKDAFDVLALVLDRRCRRGLTTVIDATSLDAKQRLAWQATARKHGLPVHAVVFATPDAVCRARNRARERPVPSKVLTTQLRAAATVAPALAAEGWDGVHAPGPVTLVPPHFLHSPAALSRQEDDPMPLDFGLHIARFPSGDAASTAAWLADVAGAAEAAGFTSIWVMDHFVQIPTVGREWDDMLESYTTLGFLAGRTSTARLGVLVTGVTYRNLAHLAKIVATLDVLSGGRAVCGLGAAWFRREHELYGWDFPPIASRYALLEDALELLPLMWGPGSPPFTGRTVSLPAATCYPRPLQERVPIWVGGSGEKDTLRLVAKHADGCNLFGDPATVAHKVAVLRDHCARYDRDPADITITHLGTATILPDGAGTAGATAAGAVARPHPDAGTLDEQTGRYRELAEAGVRTAIVDIPDLPTTPAALTPWTTLISRFRPSTPRSANP